MGKNSLESHRLANWRQQLTTGKTRGATPRDLNDDEKADIQQRYDELFTKLKARPMTRLNNHVTAEVDRAVRATEASTSSVNAHRTDVVGGLMAVVGGLKRIFEEVAGAMEQNIVKKIYPSPTRVRRPSSSWRRGTPANVSSAAWQRICGRRWPTRKGREAEGDGGCEGDGKGGKGG